MKPKVTWRIEFNDLPKIAAELPEIAGQVVRKTAFDAQAIAQDESAVDTGAQKASIYTSTDQGSDYSAAVSEAQSLRPGAPVVDEVTPERDLEAIVGVGVEYGIYNEYGGKAFMGPAAERVRGPFEQAMKEALKGLCER